jgi:PAS domain S-box-containing protein
MQAPKMYKKYGILIAAAITFAALSAAMTIWIVERLRFDAQEQARVYQILNMKEALLSSLIDVENGQRGFLLTKDPSFLKPYQVAITNLDHQYNQLSGHTKNPSLKKLLLDLKPLIDRRLDLVDQTLRYEREGQHTLALEMLSAGIGKQYMDQIRMLIADFKHKELEILQQRTQQFHNTIQMLAFVIGMTFFLAILFSSALFVRIQRLKDDAERKLSFRNALLESTDIAIVATNTDFVILSANPAAEKLFGFSAQRWIGIESLGAIIQHLQNIVQIDYMDAEKKTTAGNWLEILDTPRDVLHFEGDYDTEGAVAKQVAFSITKAKNSEGHLIGYILLSSDISHIQSAHLSLKQSEQLYRKSTEHLKNIIDSSIDIICTIDANGNFVEVGAASIHAWGFAPEELIGKRFIEFVHPDDRALTNLVAEEITKGNPTKNFHNRYMKKDGHIAHMMWSAIWSERDQLMYAIARDETDAIKISAELKATEMLLKLAGDISKVGGWSLDLVSEKYFWTSQVYKILEFPEGYTHTLEERLKLYTEESRTAFLEAVDKCKSVGSRFDLQLKTKTNLGKLIDTRLIGHPVTNEQGEVIGITGAVQEITEQKNLEQALIDAKENAISANAAKDVFLSTMSHEIRTPLNGMLGMLDLLSYSALNSEQQDMLHTAIGSGKNLVRIINDLLDHSKIEAGKLQIIDEVVSLSDLINRLQLSYFALASSKNLMLKKLFQPDIAPFHVLDSLRLTQILGNLLSNAIKFTATGYVEIQVQRIKRYEKSEMLSFSVIDTGIGISEEAQKRLFQPFEQASDNTARLYGGTGLGLSISRKLAEMMGGRLELYSQHNQGSKFTLTIELPIAEISAANPMIDITSTEIDQDVKNGLRLLIVDDHPVNRKLLSRQLGKLNITVDIAENGVVALQKYNTNAYDLVITDCNMPEMDGYELAKQIRKVENTTQSKRVPIIAWTANAMSDARENVIKAGMDDILVKPSELALVKAKILQWTTDSTLPEILPQAAPEGMLETKLFDLTNVTDVPAEQCELLMDYCLQTSKDLDLAGRACNQQLPKELKRVIHQIKGASRLVGSEAITSLCENLEVISEEQNWDLYIESLAQIDSELSRIRQFLQTYWPLYQEKSQEA